jgi:hypothetical protein
MRGKYEKGNVKRGGGNLEKGRGKIEGNLELTG